MSEWRAEEIRAGAGLAKELNMPLVSSQPQYTMLWRVIEEEVVPRGTSWAQADRLVAGRQGALTGKYLPGEPPPEGTRATDDKGGADNIRTASTTTC